MANKKKRNKKYHGVDAAKPINVVKVNAVRRHPAMQYWVDHKQFVRPISIGILIAFGVIMIVTGIVAIVAGAH